MILARQHQDDMNHIFRLRIKPELNLDLPLLCWVGGRYRMVFSTDGAMLVPPSLQVCCKLRILAKRLPLDGWNTLKK